MKIAFIAMSGIRACDQELLRLGLTLPGFVERSKTIASLPSLGLLTLAGMTPPEHQTSYIEVADIREAPEPESIPDPGTPPPSSPATVARGKEIYEQMKCASCHGPSGRGDGPGVADLRDDGGRPIPVRDFTGGTFRGGGERADLYHRFVTGMDGSPMPSYAVPLRG